MKQPLANQAASDSQAAGPLAPATPAFRYVILQTDGLGRIAGTVLQADAELIALLDKGGIEYRDANDRERNIGGFR